MTGIYRLVHGEARRRALDAVRTAPEGHVVRVSEATRNLEQNALLHALVTEIADAVPWAGRLRSVEVWKRLLTAAWLRARGESLEILPALDGHGVDVVFRRTSDLNKSEFSELVEFVQCWMAENMPETVAG